MNSTTFPPPDDQDDRGFDNYNSSYDKPKSYGGGGGGYPNNQRQGGYQGNNGNQNRGNWSGGGGNRGNYGGNNRGNWNGGGNKPWQGEQDTDMTLYKPYAVTGNKDAPPDILKKIEDLVRKLEVKGYTLRTGGLQGIEEVAELAATKKELHLPFRGFADKESKFTFSSDRVVAIARQFQPGYDGLKKGAQTFCNKNVRLVLGKNAISPALFLIVWTEDGAESGKDRTNQTGFAGHPIAIASALGIPVFNLGNPTAEGRLNFYLESLPDNPQP